MLYANVLLCCVWGPFRLKHEFDFVQPGVQEKELWRVSRFPAKRTQLITTAVKKYKDWPILCFR